jgi:HlyD family secretion protein
MKKSRRLSIGGAVVVVIVGGVYGLSTLNGASNAIDPSKLATVERGVMLRSVVATGKVEPITKVEIKSKANGIIERLHVDVDQVVQPGQVLAELDKENLTARLREARANFQASQAAHEAAVAQLRKNEIEAESPEVEFARRNFTRAQQLFDQKLVAQNQLDALRARWCSSAARRWPRPRPTSPRPAPPSSAPTRNSPMRRSARPSAQRC